MLTPIAAADKDETLREEARLGALCRLDVIDTPPEEAFDRVTRLTRQIFSVPMSTITLIDGHRQWFKSRQGMPSSETPKDHAICKFAIQQDEPLIVPDTLSDSRFRDNVLVTGAPHIRFYAGVQLRSEDGYAVGTLCAMDNKPRSFDRTQIAMLVDLAGIVMNELQLRTLAMRDGLTGAHSRRAFREEATRALTRATRHKHDLSCVIFDLDHFKSINDLNGHAVGDLVLKSSIEVCQQELRETDVIGRIGGEEFGVLLPYTSRDAAMSVAEKVRAAMTRIHVQGKSGAVKVSASFGIASLDLSVADIDDLLARADTALYQAKNAGRNTCVAWQPAEAALSSIVHRVFKAGQITFNSGRQTIDCTVRALSDTGAILHVSNTAEVPAHFKLQIPADDIYRFCKATRKTDKNLEVEFE
jgi:diguanylate cyclase (GGDEF)-like protein